MKHCSMLKKLIFVLLLLYSCNAIAWQVVYYCPTPEDFINTNNKLVAKTRYHQFKYTWLAEDKTPSQFPEYPLTFKGANLVNCKGGLCDIKCYYYSNIEGHLITSTISSTKNISLFEYPNRYLNNFSCQYTEHVDCPFLVDI
ncbi:hypothetical protein LA55_1606 [Francisella philomiragia]|uniref:Lipoprotein n=2 Tax=Francisella philomiragia TaxID=28110 RepID=A0A0B6D6G2_9GAMM|nr:hypothetical protein LA55_1606 [Francisella philomiragia]